MSLCCCVDRQGLFASAMQGRMTPMSGTTAAIPHIKRPGAPKVEWLGPTSTMHIPGTFTVSDRKVRDDAHSPQTLEVAGSLQPDQKDRQRGRRPDRTQHATQSSSFISRRASTPPYQVRKNTERSPELGTEAELQVCMPGWKVMRLMLR